MKYGADKKSNIVAGVILFIVGVLFLVGDSSGFSYGGVCVIFGITILIQMEQTLLMSSLVQSSPVRRSLDIDLLDVMSLIISASGYIFIFIFALCITLMKPELSAVYASQMVMVGINIALTVI